MKEAMNFNDFLLLPTDEKFIEMCRARDERNQSMSFISVDVYYTDRDLINHTNGEFVAIINESTVLPHGNSHEDKFHVFDKCLDMLLTKCYYFLLDPLTANFASVDKGDRVLNEGLDDYIAFMVGQETYKRDE